MQRVAKRGKKRKARSKKQRGECKGKMSQKRGNDEMSFEWLLYNLHARMLKAGLRRRWWVANACSDGDELIDDGRPRCNDERGDARSRR